MKICGVTSVTDAVSVCLLGADALGLVFFPPSPRAVSVARAREISAAIPPFVTAVGLFVNPTAGEVRRVCDEVPIDLLQFHGDESPDECERFGLPYVKAIPMRPGLNVEAQANRFKTARGLLVDTYKPNLRGGSGEVFDWNRVPECLPRPLILAGGLTAGNVAAAIARVRPFAVDVSGGVESSKGVKDPAKVAAFIRGVNSGATTDE